MLNSKQRAKLRSLVSKLEPTLIIGKDGLTETVLIQLDKELTARELIKVSVLESSEMDAKECLHKASLKLGAEEVNSIGRKFSIYRFSTKKGVKHIDLN